ncbi:hypothetical protein G7046_g717 [Stylonectria norvegica]|nr:hypothetical protein G7046_g717 [Stylonectria norvegica]
MPALLATSLLADQHAISNISASSLGANASNPALQVVCAWPVSGQYGPGSRVLYYVLIAACVFARKSEWLKHACLAAALLIPAVAALHGIVLAAVHVEGAVDMDVFGAFQLCSIGILAAPVTVRLSRTYFNDPGRNTIFIWAGLLLAGLLSLTVEFYRINTSSCMRDRISNPITPNETTFPYGENTCGLTCSVDLGPFSPMRGGSVNNIYVIPAPDRLTFGAATLLAAACCVHAILWLASMCDKILEINWRSRWSGRGEREQVDEPIEGTNGATTKKMLGVNEKIRFFLSVAAVPVFGGAGLTILIIGERNFFSPQVSYQTEPIGSVGQWAPIAGTALGLLGSLYLLLARDVVAVKEETNTMIYDCRCNGSHHHRYSDDAHVSHDDDGSETMSQERQDASLRIQRTQTVDAGNRRKVASVLITIGKHLGTAAHELLNDWMDDPTMGEKARQYPEIPGESFRHRGLQHIRSQYNGTPDIEGDFSFQEYRSRRGSVSTHSIGRRSTVSADPTSNQTQDETQNSSNTPIRHKPIARRATLEVPTPVHFGARQNKRRSDSASASSITSSFNAPQVHVPSSPVVGPNMHRTSTDRSLPTSGGLDLNADSEVK